jgi:chromosome segregation ATPase
LVRIVQSLFTSIALSALGVGALLGAAVASLVWYQRARRVRRDYSFTMRRRAAQAEKVREQFSDLKERLRRQEEEMAELVGARQDLASHRVELEQTRATLEDAQRALDAARTDAADAESRFEAQLDSERTESAARRHAVESELSGTRDALVALQEELRASRATAQQTIARLEADLDATRSTLDHSASALRGEREAAAAMREELRTQIGAADRERQRLDAEFQEERRQWADKLAATQPYVASMREQYLLAASERDAMTREIALQRQRMDESARVLEQTRAEFALALDEEHRSSMTLLNRAWSYVQTFPRVPDAWNRPAARATAAPERAHAHREGADVEARIEVEREADRAVHSHPAPAAPVPADSNPPEYDIEAELADAIADDLEAPSFARTRKTRKPVGTVKVGNETVVVCDDGSTWRRTDRGWRQLPPVPGTPVQLRHAADAP